jgi:hypothetical protein
MHRLSDSAIFSLPLVEPGAAEPGAAELQAAVAAMTAQERLARFWRMQEIAIARSWALVERSGVEDPMARIELVIRARYPEWSDAEVSRLIDAICAAENPEAWLERLRVRAAEITERLQAS